MLSILIPIYNCDVRDLVKALHQQCLALAIPFEICCFDDQSSSTYKKKNDVLKHYSQVHYRELPKNIGRSSIRNLLAREAHYPYLLFLDGDAKVNNSKFIGTYTSQLSPNTLLYGGCQYQDTPPENAQKHLHYYFGKNREEIASSIRQMTPYASFKTFNFLIPKTIFDSIQFDESIRQYGHEDTLFGMELKKRKIKINHINNPLEHAGLENRSTFLNKQQLAIDTLYQLFLNGKHPEARLLKVFQRCQHLKIDGLVNYGLTKLSPFIQRQLMHNPSKIFYLDLYKLAYLLKKKDIGRY